MAGRPRKSAIAETTLGDSTQTQSATSATTRRRGRRPGIKNKTTTALATNGRRTRSVSGSPINAFREGLAFYREMQQEIGLPGQPHISAQEWTEVREELSHIVGMVTRLCERDGVDVTPLRTGTGG